MKDHEFGKLHNDLRDTAKKYHGAEQLRSRLSGLVYPLEQENTRLNTLVDKVIEFYANACFEGGACPSICNCDKYQNEAVCLKTIQVKARDIKP